MSITVDTARHLRRYEPETPADVLHGVHLDCQRDAEMKVTRCGLAVDDGGCDDDGNGAPTTCADCNAVAACPVCSAVLAYTVSDVLRGF